ncbi:hypothetical protein CKAH01_10959 [Colletotrichum kahawae]|uniref:Uncharacterized protein n=1 Tax=Colletotrichum kahawae TaxID=34407 RepID=A0AAD9XW63_COLKA|nr:hypothetical protein CKAH01_10959 [Colletotrichum kahawae]
MRSLDIDGIPLIPSWTMRPYHPYYRSLLRLGNSRRVASIAYTSSTHAPLPTE